MNIYLILAALLTFVALLAHSILGERLIFSSWRKTYSQFSFEQGIIWSSWHILSLFGLGLSLLLYAFATELLPISPSVKACMIGVLIGSSALIGFGTRWRHPAWLVFILLSLLIALS